MTLLWALVWIVVMGTAMGHIFYTYQSITNGTASSPMDKSVRLHTVVAIGCLFVAFFIPSPTYAVTTESEIEVRLTTTFNQLLRELPTLESREHAKELIRAHILPITDTHKAARLMLGKNWRQASVLQRKRFTAVMTNKMVNMYTAFLLDERAQTAKFRIERVVKKVKRRGNAYTVKSVVTVDDIPTDVGFTILEPKGKDWKVVDITVEGISMVMTWRSTFNELIKRPGDLDLVIIDLESTNLDTKE